VAVDLSFYTSPLSEEIRDEGRAQGRIEGQAVVPVGGEDVGVSGLSPDHQRIGEVLPGSPPASTWGISLDSRRLHHPPEQHPRLIRHQPSPQIRPVRNGGQQQQRNTVLR